MSFFTRYGYLYWIPFFPLSKVSVVECQHCKRTSPQEAYNPAMRSVAAELKPQVSNPKWYWSGLMVIGALFLFSSVSGIIAGAKDSADYRSALYKEDLKSLTNEPTMETDSISAMLDIFLTPAIVDDFDPENIRYTTKQQNGKTLVLMDIPNLSNAELSAIEEIVPALRESVEAVSGTDNELYLGVMSRGSKLYAVETPRYRTYESAATKQQLYDFYGMPVEE